MTAPSLSWDLIHGGWAYILWKEPGKNRRSAVKELRAIESKIKTDGLKGWIAESEFQYRSMHRILRKLGAKVYAQDKESFYFKKEIPQEKGHGEGTKSTSTATA